MATYSTRDLGRREILRMSAVLAGSGMVFSPKFAAAEAALERTPDQILGPFYPLSELPQTSDLTRVSRRSGRAEGQVLKPAAYPAGPNRMRPAHIHFQVTGQQDKIVTQMYFENDPYNDRDPFLNSVGGRKELLITRLQDPPPDSEPDLKMVVFDIVLYKG